jgi:hypothetical protein
MGDYNIAFKFHGNKTKDPKAYPWPDTQDKAFLDPFVVG